MIRDSLRNTLLNFRGGHQLGSETRICSVFQFKQIIISQLREQLQSCTTTKMQYKGKSAQRFISNATTNGVWAWTTDLFHIKPELNPGVNRGIHTCNDIKESACVYRICICCNALIRLVISLSEKASMPDIAPQQLPVYSTLTMPPLV